MSEMIDNLYKDVNSFHPHMDWGTKPIEVNEAIGKDAQQEGAELGQFLKMMLHYSQGKTETMIGNLEKQGAPVGLVAELKAEVENLKKARHTMDKAFRFYLWGREQS